MDSNNKKERNNKQPIIRSRMRNRQRERERHEVCVEESREGEKDSGREKNTFWQLERASLKSTGYSLALVENKEHFCR